MQMNLPLRAVHDRLAMLAALRDGTRDYLATDLAPHTLEEKAHGVSGQPHLDTYGVFVTWLLIKQDFFPEQVATFCSVNPGDFVNPYCAARRFGRIEPGYTAPLTVLNLARPQTIRREDLFTKCGWSPFEDVTTRRSPSPCPDSQKPTPCQTICPTLHLILSQLALIWRF